MSKGLDWSKVKAGKSVRANGASNIADETEYRERDAAARWLKKNDTPKQRRRAKKGSKKNGR